LPISILCGEERVGFLTHDFGADHHAHTVLLGDKPKRRVGGNNRCFRWSFDSWPSMLISSRNPDSFGCACHRRVVISFDRPMLCEWYIPLSPCRCFAKQER
jgi:hypothetical protein